jgi:hypothetical protein
MKLIIEAVQDCEFDLLIFNDSVTYQKNELCPIFGPIKYDFTKQVSLIVEV